MDPVAAGAHPCGVGQGTMLVLELGEARIAVVARINVEHDHGTGRNRNVRVRPRCPPMAHLGFVSRCVAQSLGRQRAERVLALMFASQLSTSAQESGVRGQHRQDRPARENPQAAARIVERGVKQCGLSHGVRPTFRNLTSKSSTDLDGALAAFFGVTDKLRNLPVLPCLTQAEIGTRLRRR